MASAFLEIWFEGDSLQQAGFGGRSGIEDDLAEALECDGLGEVTGGGGGVRGSNIDIDIEDDSRLEEALDRIRRILRDLRVPSTARIIQREPTESVYPVYE